MQEFKSFSKRLETLTLDQFDDFALELVQFQAQTNPVYAAYLQARKINPTSIQKLEDIPYLPIQFYKNTSVFCGNGDAVTQTYSSSGTTGSITSKHLLWSEDFYLNHAQRLFEQEYGPLTDFHILALLPAYLERPGSSLVAMASHFIRQSNSEASGFYLYNQKELLQQLASLARGDRKVLLLGVTFALLDLVESKAIFQGFSNLIVMETGGMKGRRREMVREEVHQQLKVFFKVEQIHSEYGMTELLSQVYSKGNGKFQLPSCMRVMLRDLNDPFSPSIRSQGGINLIDLANFHSCAFIETQDIGLWDESGFLEVLGRFDHSELRGCNHLVQ
ncbi:MAG: acyl transferase [Bacteroidetes bacterium]|nr:acyl transferase [Bacteroidota bacterium]